MNACPGPDDRAVEVCKHLREHLEPRLGKWEHGKVPEPCSICRPIAEAISTAVEVAIAVDRHLNRGEDAKTAWDEVARLKRAVAVQRMALALVDENHKNERNWVRTNAGPPSRYISAEERRAVIEALDQWSH